MAYKDRQDRLTFEQGFSLEGRKSGNIWASDSRPSSVELRELSKR